MRQKEHLGLEAWAREIDRRETQNFLVGLCNGLGMSVLLTMVAYWVFTVL